MIKTRSRRRRRPRGWWKPAPTTRVDAEDEIRNYFEWFPERRPTIVCLWCATAKQHRTEAKAVEWFHTHRCKTGEEADRTRERLIARALRGAASNQQEDSE